jgi:hypothetical protein
MKGGDPGFMKKATKKSTSKKSPTITDKLNTAYETMAKKNGPC